MDLLSGKTYWDTTVKEPPAYSALNQDLECDVLIVGGGSAGAQCAYYLADKGLNVALVDKRKVGFGSTVVNTALVQYLGDKLFYENVNTFGEGLAVRHYQLCEQAINEMETAASEVPIPCEFVRRDSFYYASYPEDIEKIDKDYYYLHKHGFNAEILSQQDIESKFPFSKRYGLLVKGDAEINPYKFTLGLLQLVESKGVNIYENTEIVGKEFHHDGAILHTKDKHSIKAKHVIFSGGYENQDIKVDKNAVISSTYNIVTTPVKDFSGWENRELIWESARPYIYLRTTSDNRIIVGGLDEDTNNAEKRDSKLLHKKEQLLKELFKLFPSIQAEVEFYIGASYGGTHDGLPFIGLYEDMPNAYFLCGYGDNGLVYNMVLAKILGELLVENKMTNLDLYSNGKRRIGYSGVE
ncbi:NAD(P)/FAD-dependent oxidoreductase [Rossellomorea aquimaris]|uniref:NAD(P)/FAD-dependent oxidoreductase n=1 Tax=Rossellomorea aquimaris TaxID=189382 RepID=UPI0007D088E9|nr:FAD-dependent oxidoreductase [Rossellomorea aquimaris]